MSRCFCGYNHLYQVKRVFLLAAAVLCAALVVFWLLRPARARMPEAQYQKILDEVMGVDFVFRSPTPDPGSHTLAYVHAARQGRGLYLLDLAKLDRAQVPVTNEVTQVSGWSPDGRLLVFIQSPEMAAGTNAFVGNTAAREEWITIYDRQDGSVRRLTDSPDVIESFFFWLTPETYFFVSRALTNNYAEIFMGRVGESSFRKVSNYRPELVVMGDNMAAHLEGGNILSLQIKPLKDTDKGTNHSSRTVRQLSDFSKQGFDVIKWLRYSRDNGKFMFCARPAGSPWRYVYQFDPATQELTQLSNEDTYNGQWLQRGNGYAYVGNTNNSFFLAVRPGEAKTATNLFLNGSVVNYTVAPDGDHIFVTAALGVEPQGLWEYSLTNRALRRVKEGTDDPFKACRIIEPTEYRVTSPDGVRVPCFLFTPDHRKSGLFTRKTPAVVFLPPATGQFKRSFDARAELLANLGFYFLAVNYRGCDGYGREYSQLGSASGAAQDILAALNDLLSRVPDVDRKRIFLSSSSDGSALAYELLAEAPERWRAVVMESPTAPPMARLNAGELPPIFFATGDQDGAFRSLMEFQQWGNQGGADIRSITLTNSGHITYKSNQRKEKLEKVSRFILERL